MTKDLERAYDYVIAGAGSSGCIIAAELAKAGAEVLLVEAGGNDGTPEVLNPRMGFMIAETDLVQSYATCLSPKLNFRNVPAGQGRVLGGGGSTNVMVWMRGFASDFEAWAKTGCAGWSFADVLPVFKRLESWEGGANAYRGSEGPIEVRRPTGAHPVFGAWIAAGLELGLEPFDDINSPMRAGVGYTNVNIDRKGLRCSSARAYLYPALGLPNLTLALNTHVARLLIRSGRCVGCHVVSPGGAQEIYATQEMIVAAGGIGSPHLLLRSGIGPAGDLGALDLDVHADLPDVGCHYQDHPMVRGLVMRTRDPLPDAQGVTNNAEVCSLFRSGEVGNAPPDLMGVAISQPAVTAATEAKYGPAPPCGHGFTLATGLMQPSSRGSVKLADSGWRTPPIIDNGLLKTELDLKVAVRGLEHLREMSRQPALAALIAEEAIPGDKIGQADLADFARQCTHTFWHPVGTCRMGSKGDSVVAPNLKVHGVERLRVCDSSIMPRNVSAPTNAASCMIGLKAADMILAAQ